MKYFEEPGTFVSRCAINTAGAAFRDRHGEFSHCQSAADDLFHGFAAERKRRVA